MTVDRPRRAYIFSLDNLESAFFSRLHRFYSQHGDYERAIFNADG